MRFRGGFALAEALEALGPLAETRAPRDAPDRFSSLDAPARSDRDSLAVAGSGTRLSDLEGLRAALLLAEPGVTGIPVSIPVLRVRSARRAVAALLNAFAVRILREASGVGEGTRVEPGAVVHPHVRIGRNCVIQSGAVIGCAGFGFFDDGGDAEPMPHPAGVEIGDGCFIGANTVVAAGVLHPTSIGDYCKLDSLVQIAHNVRLGRNGRIASQSGIAGSTEIGDGFRMGGAASVAGHLRLGDNVSVAARSGVTKDWPGGSVVAGFPAMPIRAWRRREALLRRLEREGSRISAEDFA